MLREVPLIISAVGRVIRIEGPNLRAETELLREVRANFERSLVGLSPEVKRALTNELWAQEGVRLSNYLKSGGVPTVEGYDQFKASQEEKKD